MSLQNELDSYFKSVDPAFELLVSSVPNSSDFQALEKPSNALCDIAKLCHAHTTKLGIAFKPPISIEAAEKTLKDWYSFPMSFVIAYRSLLQEQKYNEADIVVSEIRTTLIAIIYAYESLTTALKTELDAREDSLINPEYKTPVTNHQQTLKLIGMLWGYCNKIIQIASHDLSDITAERLSDFVTCAEDAKNDLVYSEDDQNDEFAENLAKFSEEQINGVLSKISKIIILWKLIVSKRCKAKKLSEESYRTLWAKCKSISELIDDFACEANDGNWDESLLASIDKELFELLDIVETTDKDEQFNTIIAKFRDNYKSSAVGAT